MQRFLVAILSAAVLFVSFSPSADVPRGADGKPDLSGTYDIATVTPLERPKEFGETLTLPPERARQSAAQVAAAKQAGLPLAVLAKARLAPPRSV